MAFTPPTGPVIDEPIRPRALWYWIGAAVIVAAIAGAVFWLVSGILRLDDTVDGFERVPYPEGGTVTIADPGEYVVYTESFSGDEQAGGITVVDPDGNEVDTRLYVSSLTYDFGGEVGSASQTFTAEQAGEYELSSTGLESSGISSLAVGKSIGGDIVSAIVGAFVIGGLGVLVGVIVLIVTGIRRSSAKRERRPPTPPPSAWGQQQQTWGANPPPPQAAWGQPPPPPGSATPGTSAPPPPGAGDTAPPPPPGWPT